MSLNIPEQEFEQTRLSAQGNTVKIAGKIVAMAPNEFMEPFFEKAYQQLAEVPEFNLDLTELGYVNSSGIGSILKNLKMRQPGQKVHIKSNRSYAWQKHSVHLFQIPDKENISIEE